MEKIEKILDREIAWRIFAYEFNISNLYTNEGEERAPNYIMTPTGAKCNRLFIIGVVTEVENIGKDNNLWRARIADPTGVFTVYAGQYQPEAAIFLSDLQVPAYVALVGKARKYEPEDGTVYLSVRPEEINSSDEKQRDRWVLETAERTLERIIIIEEALNSKLTGNELQDFLAKKVTNTILISGVMLAIQHYNKLDKTMLELKKVLAHAVETVASDGNIKKSPQKAEETREQDGMDKTADEFRTQEINEIVEETQIPREPDNKKDPLPLDSKELLAAIIDELDTGKGTTFSRVIETAQKGGINAECVESSIKELMDEGRCYEPRIGILRKV